MSGHLSLRRCIDSAQNSRRAHDVRRNESKEFNQMTQAPKEQDKPRDPPYSGGEDEKTENRKAKAGVNEPPVDESDDGRSAS
jgi:hypothetical protein